MVFGEVLEGMEIVTKIENLKVSASLEVHECCMDALDVDSNHLSSTRYPLSCQILSEHVSMCLAAIERTFRVISQTARGDRPVEETVISDCGSI